MRNYCDDERDHQRKAERDAEYQRRDYDYYDRFTDDPCKQIYTETYDRERRVIECREEEACEQRNAEMARQQRQQSEREFEYSNSDSDEEFNQGSE